MTFNKRHFLNATAALAVTATLFGALPTYAGGGGQTGGRADFQNFTISISGKTDAKISFSKSQMERFNSLKEKDRSAFIGKIIAQSLKKQGGIEWEYTPIDNRSWCGRCEENKGRVQNKVQFNDGITALFTARF